MICLDHLQARDASRTCLLPDIFISSEVIIKIILLKTTTLYGIFLPVHLTGKYSHGSKQDPHIESA